VVCPMEDKEKTKEQLIAELQEMRQRILDLERAELEQERTQEKLRKCEEKLKTVFESANDEICYTHIDGTVLDVNHKIEDIFGYKAEEVIGKNYAEFPILSPEDFQKSAEIVSDIVEGKPGRVLEFEGFRKDGTRVTIEVNSKLVKEGGEIKGFLNIIRDITERSKAKEALRASEQRLSFHVQQAPLAFIEWNTNLEASDWNPSAERMFGYSKEEAIGRHATELIVPEHNKDLVDFDWSELAKLQGGVRSATPNVTKDGRTIVCQWYNTPLIDEDGRVIGLASLAEDITERTQWEEELKGAKEAAEASDKAKSEFLATMSHEIRTPMNGVIGMTGLLLESELSHEQREYVETIRTSSDSLLSIINDILDFSKIEAGQLDLELLDFDLRTTVEDVIDMLAVRADGKDLEFSCLVYPDVPSLVRGDPGRLRQILTNLAGNAIKFTDKGEVFVRVTVREESDTHIEVWFGVTDTGIGIPQGSLNRLFKSFSQLDASTTRKYGGTGLGLAVSKQLAEMMGGEIGVESQEGKGSTFWFTVVLEKQPGARKSEIVVPEDIRGARLLVVDDNATNRLVLRELLRSWGCRFEETADGPQALDRLGRAVAEDDPFRIALVDMQMPDMDGKTLGEKIKADAALRDTLLVMLTSVGRRGDAAKLKEVGFAAYLIKPIKKSQLYDCLVTVLGLDSTHSREPSRPIITRHSLKEDKKRRICILVAEDNAVNQKVALRILEKIGFRADAVADGREAVEALERIPYDLVLMDVQMPEMNGFEATRMIRDPRSRVLRHDIPIIAMTAHALKGDRERCLDAGMDDYLTKPVTAFALSDVLEKHLGDETTSSPVVPEPKTAQSRPVQIERIREIADGDLECERQLIDSFLEVSEQQLVALESAIRDRNGEEIKHRAHMINGSSANAGAVSMQELACRIEQIGDSEDFEKALVTFVDLKSEFEQARQYLKDYL